MFGVDAVQPRRIGRVGLENRLWPPGPVIRTYLRHIPRDAGNRSRAHLRAIDGADLRGGEIRLPFQGQIPPVLRPVQKNFHPRKCLFEQTFSWMEVFLHWPQNWRNLALEGKANLSAAKVSPIYRAEVGTAPITSIPWDVSEVRANDWTWRPQPVFQSYAAYTPRLDRIDADHVDGKTAADFLFVSWKAIDGRHPFLEEPLTWQERLNHYQVDLHDRQHILLKRSAAPRLAPESKMSGKEATITWNQDVPVPQKPGTIVHLSIGKSVWGSLRAFAYRLNPVWMEVRRQSGREERWRMVRANMENGVLIRDLPGSLQDLALLAQTGCQMSDPVVAFRLRAGHPADYRSAIRVEWGQRATEARACTQLTETQAAFGVRGGADEVTVHGGGGRQIPVTADVPWVKA